MREREFCSQTKFQVFAMKPLKCRGGFVKFTENPICFILRSRSPLRIKLGAPSVPHHPENLASQNPSMSKSKSNPCFLVLLLFISASWASAQEDAQFTYVGFSNSTNLTLNGIAVIQPNRILRLTNDTSRLLGHAFYPQPLPFKNSSSGAAASFSTAFAFALVPEYPKLGGHGFAFVLSPTAELAGAQPSQYLGILNASDITNSTDHIFAVEFDTVQDFEFFDINDNHVGVDINNLASNKSAAAAYLDDAGSKVGLNLKSGDTIQAWVDYDGAAKLLNVTLSPFSSKPRAPLISFPLDLTPILKDRMFVGFSASTGLLASSHYLMGWSFRMNGVAPSLDLSSLPTLPRTRKTNTALIVAVSSAAVLLLAAAVAAAGYLFYKIKNADVIEPWEFEYGPHRFSYKELKRATRGFRDRELLGVGGFGRVYRGTLPESGAEVAVKRVANGSRQGIREFVAEIASIGRLRHRNLVRLQGWCRRRADLLLVYDYMPNGSLDRALFDGDGGSGRALSWDQRYRVLKNVASALLYLHEEWEHVVIHRDVKASNVLLDADLNGRLGDFGLAKLYEHGANPSTTRLVGTIGYLAPELTRTGKATTSTDVFAFGALALETVCGRRPIDPKGRPEEVILLDWVWESWAAGKWAEVLDPKLEGGFDMEEAEVAVKVGLLCSHPIGGIRPSMREVVRYLDGGDAAEVPEVRLPPGEYEGVVRGSLGFEDFVHSYPSSSFEKEGEAAEGGVVTAASSVGPYAYSPLSLLSRGSV